MPHPASHAAAHASRRRHLAPQQRQVPHGAAPVLLHRRYERSLGRPSPVTAAAPLGSTRKHGPTLAPSFAFRAPLAVRGRQRFWNRLPLMTAYRLADTAAQPLAVPPTTEPLDRPDERGNH